MSLDPILESPTERLEKFRRNRTRSLEARDLEIPSRNSDSVDEVRRKPYSKRTRSPTGKLVFSKRVPIAALNTEEYRQKRGLVKVTYSFIFCQIANAYVILVCTVLLFLGIFFIKSTISFYYIKKIPKNFWFRIIFSYGNP